MSASAEVAEAFGLAAKPVAAPAAPRVEPRPAEPAAATVAGPSVWSRAVPWVRARWVTVAADLRSAWWWRGVPPTLAQLWAGRVPARDRVPGGNAALWVSWAAYNHLYVGVAAPLYVLFFALAHPARFVLAAAVAAVLFFVWI